MKKILFVLAILNFQFSILNSVTAQTAETIEGTSYFLPKTALRFTLQIEKTTFTPGELADYAKLYFHEGDNVLEPYTHYRIINMAIETYGEPDKEQHHTAIVTPKNSISKIYTNTDGILLSVNTEPSTITPQSSAFSLANRGTDHAGKAKVDPRNYMSEDILSAGSTAKMAQLCAKEIYDIREAKTDLARGNSETLPKDGKQLALMMEENNKQEAALTSLFNGITVVDTIIKEVTICPDNELTKKLLFRFSDLYGLGDADDLSGEPYYISVTDLHKTPEDTRSEKEIKNQKDVTGLFVNIPGRAKVSVYKEEKPWTEKEFSFAQFGRTENVSPVLFNKKVATTYEVNPSTGAMINMKSELVGK